MISYYYHCTNYDTADLILKHGTIDPAFSKGRYKACFYVKEDFIEKGVIHVALRRGFSIADMCILQVRGSQRIMKSLSNYDMYFCFQPLIPHDLIDVVVWLSEQEQRFERRMKQFNLKEVWSVHKKQPPTLSRL